MIKRIIFSVIGIFILASLIVPASFARRVKDSPLLAGLIRKLSSADEFVYWAEISLDAQRQLLEMAAQELDIAVGNINTTYLQTHKFDFLNGHGLSGMYFYYQRLLRNSQEDFDSLPQVIRDRVSADDIRSITVIGFIKKVLDIIGLDEVIAILSEGRKVDWQKVPFEIQRELLEKAAKEQGKDISEIAYDDFRAGFRFINQHRLETLYKFYIDLLKKARADFAALPSPYRDKVTEEQIGGLDTIQFIKAMLDIPAAISKGVKPGSRMRKGYQNIDNIIALICSGANIYWAYVPLYIHRQLIEKAGEELGIAITEMNWRIFVNRYDFLNGYSLRGLYGYYYDNSTTDFSELREPFRSLVDADELSNMSVIGFFKSVLGISIPQAPPLCNNVNELIGRIISQGYDNLDWERVPLELQRELLDRAAKELGCAVVELDENIFKTEPLVFLDGWTLAGFYRYYEELLDRTKRDYVSLPHRYKLYIAPGETRDFTTMDFISRVMEIVYPVMPEDTAEPIYSGDPAQDTLPAEESLAGYTEREKKWIEKYRTGFYYSDWPEIADYYPAQIAFYVRELAVCVAQERGGDFVDVGKLLEDSSVFKTVKVPCLGNITLRYLLGYFGSSSSVLQYLNDMGFIEEINVEVKERLSQSD